MAFAPRGSRPKVDESTKGNTNKPIDDARQPTLIGMAFASEPPKSRERVSRKPPVPRGISHPKAVPPRRPKEGVTGSSDQGNDKVTKSRARPTPQTKPLVPRATSRPQPPARTVHAKAATSSKPGLPPRLKPAGTQVAPDALTITAQLAPWLFMRTSLEEPLQKLELDTEGILKEQREELIEMERHIEEDRKRMELIEQNEILADLVNEENGSFASSAMDLTRKLSSFLSSESGSTSTSHLTAQLEKLQDKVHSTELDMEAYRAMSRQLEDTIREGQSLKSSLDTFTLLFANTGHEGNDELNLKSPSRWKAIEERYTSLLDTRLQNLEELLAAIPLIEAYQRRRIKLEVLKLALI